MFDYEMETIQNQTSTQFNEYDLIRLFKNNGGLTFYVNKDLSYLITMPGFDSIKIRSIPHLIKMLKTVYKQ